MPSLTDRLMGRQQNPTTAAQRMAAATGMNGTDMSKMCCPKLSWKQRAYGFGACLAVGVLLDFIAWVELMKKNTAEFAVIYTIGNLVVLVGSLFFAGPRKQCQNMFAKKRRLATVVYFTMMLATLLVAVLSGVPPGARLPLVVLCMVLQVLAMIWYSLSYIPFGRDLAKKCCKKCVPTADDSV